MKRKTSKTIQIVFPILISIAWSCCSLIPSLPDNAIALYGTRFYPILSWISTHRILLALALTIVLTAILIYDATSENTFKKWLKLYLNFLMEDTFNNKYATTRITVFKRVSGVRMFCYYLKHFILCFVTHMREGTLKIHFKRFPSLFKSYLMIFVRISQPHPKGSSTYFPIVESKKEVEGVSSYCYLTKQKQVINTAYISDFYSPSQKVYTKEQSKQIKQYIEDNFISEDLLKCIHRPSNHIYAEPIIRGNDDPWGVIVVDIDSESQSAIDAKIQKRLSSAIRLSSFILNKLS